MATKFGAIELGGKLGGYTIVNCPCTRLPQDAASTLAAVEEVPIVGATYSPIWYVGWQPVNGKNFLFIAEEIRTTKNRDKAIVGLVVNVPPGENQFNGEGARIVDVIEEEDLPAEVDAAFRAAVKGLVGVSLKPIMYIGKQVVKGVNYCVLASSTPIYPGATPRAVVVAVNVFEGVASIAGIQPVGEFSESIFGYAFTWLKGNED